MTSVVDLAHTGASSDGPSMAEMEEFLAMVRRLDGQRRAELRALMARMRGAADPGAGS